MGVADGGEGLDQRVPGRQIGLNLAEVAHQVQHFQCALYEPVVFEPIQEHSPRVHRWWRVPHVLACLPLLMPRPHHHLGYDAHRQAYGLLELHHRPEVDVVKHGPLVFDELSGERILVVQESGHMLKLAHYPPGLFE